MPSYYTDVELPPSSCLMSDSHTVAGFFSDVVDVNSFHEENARARQIILDVEYAWIVAARSTVDGSVCIDDLKTNAAYMAPRMLEAADK